MTGYYEGEAERLKGITEVIRIATTYFVNTQPIEGGARTPHQLWPLPWDKAEEGRVIETISEEEQERRQKLQDDFLIKNF